MVSGPYVIFVIDEDIKFEFRMKTGMGKLFVEFDGPSWTSRSLKVEKVI